MGLDESIYLNGSIRDQLQASLAGSTFADNAWEPNYFGVSKLIAPGDEDIYVIGTYVEMDGVDSAGCWAFSVNDDGKVSIKLSYFHSGESTYWDAVAIAKLKYPDLKDLVLD